MFKELRNETEFLGFECKTPHWHMVFGSANLNRSKLIELFPDYSFRFLNQFHGCDLVESNPTSARADAHWSHNPFEALVIQTADCQPVLFASANLVVAVHAGWRGVASHLPKKAAQFFSSTLKSNSPFKIAVGPHILFKDFEVGHDVADHLILSDTDKKYVKNHQDPQKKYIDLYGLTQQQIWQGLNKQAEVDLVAVSTLSDLRFHSYRRGKEKSDRQYSFVVKLT